MRASELKELSESELISKLKDLKEELFSKRLEKAMAKMSQPHRFKEIRRDIARVLTVLNERRRQKNG